VFNHIANTMCTRFSLKRARLGSVALALVVLIPTVALGARDRSAPTAPTNLRIASAGLGAYTIPIAWNPSTDDSGQLSYLLALIDGYASLTASVPKTQTAYTWGVTGHALKPGKSYKLYLWAFDAAGNRSGISNQITVTLPADTTPPTAPVVGLQSIGSDYVSLAWTGAVDDGPAAAVRFRVFRDGAIVADDLDLRGFTHVGLDEGTTYTYQVQSRDPHGNWSPLSNGLTVTTPVGDPGDVTAPTIPTGLWADQSGDGSGEFSLRWAQSSDDFTPQSRIRYSVFVDGVFSDLQIGRGGPSINYVDGEESLVQVFAEDEVGNQSDPAAITVRLNP
jgi:hypothetical protein